jgi:hypothetical protein
MADEEATKKYLEGKTLPFKPQPAVEETDERKA